MSKDLVGAYFGQPWPSGICDEGVQRPTPVNEECGYCKEKIEEGHAGIWLNAGTTPIHKECNYRAVSGGIGHHINHSLYCGYSGIGPDAGLTSRQSSLLVWQHVIMGLRVTEEDLKRTREENLKRAIRT